MPVVYNCAPSYCSSESDDVAAAEHAAANLAAPAAAAVRSAGQYRPTAVQSTCAVVHTATSPIKIKHAFPSVHQVTTSVVGEGLTSWPSSVSRANLTQVVSTLSDIRVGASQYSESIGRFEPRVTQLAKRRTNPSHTVDIADNFAPFSSFCPYSSMAKTFRPIAPSTQVQKPQSPPMIMAPVVQFSSCTPLQLTQPQITRGPQWWEGQLGGLPAFTQMPTSAISAYDAAPPGSGGQSLITTSTTPSVPFAPAVPITNLQGYEEGSPPFSAAKLSTTLAVTTTPEIVKPSTAPTSTVVYAHTLPDSLLAPSKFSGETQSPESNADWLAYTKKYFRYRKIAEPEQLQLISLLLIGSANDWLESLPAEDKSSMERFEQAFRQTYLINDHHAWRSGIQLFETQQKMGEPIDCFYARLKKLTRHIPVSDELMQSAILHGLRSATRVQVLQHGVKDLQTTLQNIRLVEANQPTDPSTSILLEIQRSTADSEQKRIQQLEQFKNQVQSQISQQMQGLQDQLQRLTTVSNINTNVQAETEQGRSDANSQDYQMRPRRPSSDGQRSVRFQENWNPPPTRRPLRDTSKNRQREMYRASAAGTNGPPRQQMREERDNSQQNNWPPRQGPWYPEENGYRCDRCNRDARHTRCPAIGKSCYLCHGRDHFSAACKASHRPRQ